MATHDDESPAQQPSGNFDRDKFSVISKDDGTQDKFDIFVDWLVRNGGKFPYLELKEYAEEVRGCHSTRDLEADEVIIAIPLKCLITVEMGKATDIGRKVLAANLDLDAPKHVYLMLFLLTDRLNPTSFFKPYYDILPATLSNMPVFWSDEELSWLSGSYLLTQVEDRKEAISEDYHDICSIAPEFAEVATLDEFMWARMVVCSRNFGMVVNRVRTSALVPYADMLNHHRPRETKWQFDNESQHFTITTLHPLVGGAQVYDSYGKKCNHRFLLNYGFSIERNVEEDGSCPNEVSVPLCLDATDPLFQPKNVFWLRDGTPQVRRIRVAVGDNQQNMREMMSYLRLAAADEEELQAILGMQRGRLSITARDVKQPLSVANEKRMLLLLHGVMQKQLDGYPTTLEDDREALAATTTAEPAAAAAAAEEPATPVSVPSLVPFSNQRHAVIQVAGEKEVLRFYQRLSEEGRVYLTETSAAARDALVERLYAGDDEPIADYLCGVLSGLTAAEDIRRQDSGEGPGNADSSPPTTSTPAAAAAEAAGAGAGVAGGNPAVCEQCKKSEAEAGGLYACGRCGSVFFCSRKCQNLAWPTHRGNCKALAQARAQAQA